MAGVIAGDPTHDIIAKSRSCNDSQYKMDEPENLESGWYFSRKEIEENSPSRRDGIDSKKEAYLRKSYCTFLQDLGMRLKVPQVTIATAIVFCHRFFLRQSHLKNDRKTVATVCMFLAGKVEESPRPLKDIIIVSYEIIHKKDPSAVQKIKQKEVYEQQKELIIIGERLVLSTLGFEFNVHHPYKPLVEAIKKFKVAQNALAQVAWNFVNDGLRTSLCLQFKPHHIAAGAIFLAAKFLKVKLPSDGDKVWWQEFDVTPRQLEDVSNQMLELYEQNRGIQPSQTNEVEGSNGGRINPPAKPNSTVTDNSVSVTGPSQNMAINVKPETQVVLDNSGSADTRSIIWDNNLDGEGNVNCHQNKNLDCCSKEYKTETSNYSKSSLERPIQDGVNDLDRTVDSKHNGAIPKIDKDKVKAALEKRRKLRNDGFKKIDIIDEDDLIERELEKGIEMATEDEKTKKNGCPESLNSQQKKIESKSFDRDENWEEGELSSLEEHEVPSPKLLKHKGIDCLDQERDHKKPRCEIRD